jgi:shikimate 5-dehydrogenase
MHLTFDLAILLGLYLIGNHIKQSTCKDIHCNIFLKIGVKMSLNACLVDYYNNVSKQESLMQL